MIRFLTYFFIALLIIPVVQAQEFNDAQKTQIKKMFDEYLLENGETIIKSVEKYQAKRDEENQKESEVKAKEFMKDLAKKSNLPMTGNKDGDITMIEFFDYNCGYCKRALEELVIVLEKDKNLKIIFMDMPILGPPSLEASKWSLAAHKQGKYFEYHQAVLNHEGSKDESTLEKIAKEIGLNIEQMKKDKDSEDILKTLQTNVETAAEFNIRGTPGFIINGKIYPGYMPASRIIEIIEEERKG